MGFFSAPSSAGQQGRPDSEEGKVAAYANWVATRRRVMKVTTIPTPGLGDSTYLAALGGVGVVVDPQRDLERFEAAISEADVDIAFVLETHIHNDYVSGGRELARRTGAGLVLPAASGAAFDHFPAFHLEDLDAGAFSVRPIHTPGHTPEHVSYAMVVEGECVAVFSGGSLLVGAAGRSDLLGEERAKQLARLQHDSVQRLARLPGDTALYPTHGAGSFCAASPVDRSHSTIALERQTNPVLAYPDADAFVSGQLAGLQPYPSYYARMGRINLMGPAPLVSDPLPVLDPDDLPEGAVVVDVRPRDAFAAGHLPGSIGLELSPSVAVWAGWLIPFGSRVVIVAERGQDVDEVARQFGRIGFDDVAGVVYGLDSTEFPLVSFETRTTVDLASTITGGSEIQVLDVRSPAEWEAGHLEGSVHCYVPELADGLPDQLDPDGDLWMICGSGYRATAAATLVEAEGISPVVVNQGGVPDVLARLDWAGRESG